MMEGEGTCVMTNVPFGNPIYLITYIQRAYLLQRQEDPEPTLHI